MHLGDAYLPRLVNRAGGKESQVLTPCGCNADRQSADTKRVVKGVEPEALIKSIFLLV